MAVKGNNEVKPNNTTSVAWLWGSILSGVFFAIMLITGNYLWAIAFFVLGALQALVSCATDPTPGDSDQNS